MDNTIIKDLNTINDEYIITGISAGPDSMALLHMLLTNCNKKIVCVHINHNVRKQSNKEEEYLKEFCKKHNIIFESYKITSYKEKNFENEARKKRYTFYEKILKKYKSHTLLLAHHGDDLIETILMKIIRGSNLEGYSGIKTYSKVKDYTIIRPLLSFTKDDLIKYNKKHSIKYFIDKSNEDTTYTRNRIRKNILPLLKKEKSDVHINFLNYSNTLQEYYNYMEDITKEKINKIAKNNIIDIDNFKKEHPFIRKNIIFYILSDIYNNEANIIKNNHIDDIINIALIDKPNATISLPKNIIAVKEYNTLLFKKESNKNNEENYRYKFTNKVKIDDIIIKKIDTKDTNGNDVCRLNSNNIKLPLYIRNKNNGDYIYLYGTDGKKKIKDIFIEAKIPLSKRNRYPILTDADDNILWIPNIKKSKYNVKNNEFYDIILTSYKESEEKNEKEK